MPIDSVQDSRKEHRRANKPLMEKRRRARINESLSRLKIMVMGEIKKRGPRVSKLEKADILEMTVDHLNTVNRGALSTGPSSADPSTVSKYRIGFNECVNQVQRYLRNVEALDVEVRTRLLDHLATYVQDVDEPMHDAQSLPWKQIRPSAGSDGNHEESRGNIPGVSISSKKNPAHAQSIDTTNHNLAITGNHVNYVTMATGIPTFIYTCGTMNNNKVAAQVINNSEEHNFGTQYTFVNNINKIPNQRTQENNVKMQHTDSIKREVEMQLRQSPKGLVDVPVNMQVAPPLRAVGEMHVAPPIKRVVNYQGAPPLTGNMWRPWSKY